MASLLRPTTLAFAVAGLILPPATAAAGMLHEVEFRDGTRLPLELEDFEFALRPDDMVEGGPTKRIRMSEADAIYFAKVPPFARAQRVVALLAELGDDDFAVRERAAAALRNVASGFEEMLLGAASASEDPDLSWRLKMVLAKLTVSRDRDFDAVMAGERGLRGQIEPWSLTANYRGVEIALERGCVSAIRRATATTGEPQEFRAHTELCEPPVGERVRVADFENSPDGRLSSGQSVESAYGEWGLQLTTSFAASSVSAVKYLVEGGSPDQAAANLEPLFQGIITARFHLPGDRSVPAGVHFVSCRLAVVERGGTALVAYDALGAELGRATVAKGPHSFLAVESTTPIAWVELVPDTGRDADFTFDDFAFSVPQPLRGAPHERLFTVLADDGAQVHCSGFETADGFVTTRPSRDSRSVAAALSIPLKNVSSIMPPTGQRDAPPAADDSVWATFADTSMVRVDRDPTGLSVAGAPLGGLPLLALWGEGVPLREPLDPLEIPDGDAVLILRADPVPLGAVEFREREIVGLKPDGSRAIFHYSRLPTLWFRAPPPDRHARMAIPSSGVLTVDGELFRTGAEDLFELQRFDDEGLSLRLRGTKPGDAFTIAWSEVATLDVPQPVSD